MTPTAESAERSNLAEFMRRHGFDDYDTLHTWSIENRGAFWQALWDYCDVISTRRASRALENGDDFLGSRWFQGAELNFAENLLRRNDDRTAIIGVLESGERQAITYVELYRSVARVAAEFRERGIAPGDRIAGWLPNVPEAVICTLAAASLGAVWTSCSPDFGVEGALDRFGQTRPKLLIACSEYQYGGKKFNVSAKAREVRKRIESIEALLWIGDIQRMTEERPEETISFAPRGFDDPLYVLYSSGTTGKPKCIVHGVGGTLLQHLKEHRLHTDVKPEDTLFYFTTCGWMMWNWLVSGLASGCAIVLYDGSPFHPRRSELIDLIEAEGITLFGVSAKYLSALEKFGVKPRESHHLPQLRSVLSTGSPLAPESFQYVYRDFKADVALASISGGTDIVSCFALGNPILPIYPGELQCKGLGMAMEVFDEDGQSLPPGSKGELVCTKSFPSRPIGFWNDPHDVKFRAAYFEKFDNTWAHGDFAEFTDHGGMIIHGRSDAVLNPGGVRIGTAEIYRQVESMDAVVESVCVAQSWRDDVRIILFVVLQEGVTLDKTLRDEIRDRIRQNASPRHVPALVLQVNDVPRTMSGKIAELAVREVIHGREPGNSTVLANPESLDHFRDVPSLGRPRR